MSAVVFLVIIGIVFACGYVAGYAHRAIEER